MPAPPTWNPRPTTGGASLHDEVVEQLGRAIVTGDLPAGTSLTIDELTHDLGTSRGVIRESLRVLQSKGLVSARPRLGISVQETDTWRFLDADVIRWRADGPEQLGTIRDLVEFRLGVEPVAAYRAAELQDPEAIQGLLDSAALMRRAVQDRRKDHFVQADIAFHGWVLRGSGNRIFADLRTTLAACLDVRSELLTFPSDISADAISLHEQLAELVNSSEPQQAKDTANRIVEASYREVRAAAERR